MLASEHSHLSQRLCDVCMALAQSSNQCISPLAHAKSHHSCVEQHSPPSEIDLYARNFDCNLCMHVCLDPVVTMCGHLFCWPCLYYQLSLHSASKECPVCKSDVQDKIVPLYGCGKVGYSMDSLAEKFRGIRIPCRPSAATGSISRITCANPTRRSEPNRAIHFNETHTGRASRLGICTSILRSGMASSPAQSGGFLCRYAHSAVSRLVHRRRFNNEKEFVLHWVFICMASVATAVFLAC